MCDREELQIAQTWFRPRTTERRPSAIKTVAIWLIAVCLLVGRTAIADEWRIIRSDTQPVALCYHLRQVNANLASQLRQRKSIGSRAFTREELNSINAARQTILGNILQWAEEAYQKEVVEMGYDQPSGIWREHNGKRYLHLFLSDFGDQDGGITYGTVSRATSVLQLNIRGYWVRVRGLTVSNKSMLKGTVAHELFHAIQNTYAVDFSRWAKESTAEWAAEQVFPDQNHFVRIQAKYLAAPHLSLHQVGVSNASGGQNHHAHHQYALEVGRPYGVSAFWMFLSKQQISANEQWMKDLWANARTSNEAFEALSKVLGDSQKFGPKFSEYFERFAVGALLHDEAPQQYRLHDVELLEQQVGAAVVKTRAATINLRQLWQRYAEQSLRGPDSAVMTARFVPTAPSISDQTGPEFQFDQEHGGIGGAGFRIFRIPVSVLGKNDLPIYVEIPAAENEVSIQAVFKRGGGWQVERSKYDAGLRAHRVSVSEYSRTEANYVYFVVCRFSEELVAKNYPIRVSAVRAPTVTAIRLTQSGSSLLQVEWKPENDAQGKLVGRRLEQSKFEKPSESGGQVELVVTFDSDVRAGAQPVCKLNGAPLLLAPAEDDRTWRVRMDANKLTGKESEYRLELSAILHLGSCQALFPLDENPSTVAELAMESGRWTNYERDAGAMVIQFRSQKSYAAKMIVNTMVASRREGPVWLSLKLEDGGFRGLDQPYVVLAKLGEHQQYLYPSNVEAYGLKSHPLESLGSFILPENLDAPLPDQLQAVFVTADGQRLEQTFAIEYQAVGRSQFSLSSEEIKSAVDRATAQYDKVMGSNDNADRKFSMLVRDGVTVMTYAAEYLKSKTVWEQTKTMYQSARAAEGADRAWMDRTFASSELVFMGVAYRHGMVDDLLATLAERSSRGQAIVTDYIGVIDACVRFRNDTATAHRLWLEMQALPEAARARPERSTVTENWRFTFDTLADYNQPLCLPASPIDPR